MLLPARGSPITANFVDNEYHYQQKPQGYHPKDGQKFDKKKKTIRDRIAPASYCWIK
jgi:hypothetical protein